MKARIRKARKRLVAQHSTKAGLPPGSLVHIGEKNREDTQITVFEYCETTFQERSIKTAQECPLPPKGNDIIWLNVDSVHQTEVLQTLGDGFGIHPLVLEDILNTEQRPKVEDYGRYLFIVLKMLSSNSHGIEIEQVSIILGKNYVISFQEAGKPGDVFDTIRIRLRNNVGRIRKLGADFLAYSLLDSIVDNYFSVLEKLGEKLELLEEELLTEPTPNTMSTLHHLRRELLFMRKSVWPLREILSSLYRGESNLISQATELYLRDVYDHTIQVIDTVENLRDMLGGLMDIYLSSMSFRMNEIMKVLTIISTIFIPLTFIAGVYGMNFEYMPELKQPWAYPVLWLIMIGIAAVMIVYFRRKKWL